MYIPSHVEKTDGYNGSSAYYGALYKNELQSSRLEFIDDSRCLQRVSDAGEVKRLQIRAMPIASYTDIEDSIMK